jgi:hypothetical protein
LATFDEVERASTSTRGMEKPFLRKNAVFPPRLWIGKRSKTSKPLCFTKCGQEPEFGENSRAFPLTLSENKPGFGENNLITSGAAGII